MKRKFINRIEVYQRAPSDDNFGGDNVTEAKLSDSWANVKSVPTDKFTDYGLDTANEAIRVETRFRNDLDYFAEGIYLTYKSRNWIPIRIYNKDLDDDLIVIIAAQEL